MSGNTTNTTSTNTTNSDSDNGWERDVVRGDSSDDSTNNNSIDIESLPSSGSSSPLLLSASTSDISSLPPSSPSLVFSWVHLPPQQQRDQENISISTTNDARSLTTSSSTSSFASLRFPSNASPSLAITPIGSTFGSPVTSPRATTPTDRQQEGMALLLKSINNAYPTSTTNHITSISISAPVSPSSRPSSPASIASFPSSLASELPPNAVSSESENEAKSERKKEEEQKTEVIITQEPSSTVVNRLWQWIASHMSPLILPRLLMQLVSSSNGVKLIKSSEENVADEVKLSEEVKDKVGEVEEQEEVKSISEEEPDFIEPLSTSTEDDNIPTKPSTSTTSRCKQFIAHIQKVTGVDFFTLLKYIAIAGVGLLGSYAIMKSFKALINAPMTVAAASVTPDLDVLAQHGFIFSRPVLAYEEGYWAYLSCGGDAAKTSSWSYTWLWSR